MMSVGSGGPVGSSVGRFVGRFVGLMMSAGPVRFKPSHIVMTGGRIARTCARHTRAARSAQARAQAGEVGNRAFARRDNNKRYII